MAFIPSKTLCNLLDGVDCLTSSKLSFDIPAYMKLVQLAVHPYPQIFYWGQIRALTREFKQQICWPGQILPWHMVSNEAHVGACLVG